ncbi:unknown protein [Bathycoccus prasinos]|uniref:Uncharacterized protein n=1 Tax=Bathycoccus prasinos TaxID=41875 RepID=K8E9F1_9CHLO|nr:unknown protein [Bathycoccus prasinos]CCO14342.1 unknown protein [Bathycoccus prasinos]|eukprot:XP_007515463.1 unknown protein [Bathycoccus prasinos]
MHKNITREIYPLPEKQSRFLSRLSNNTRRRKKERERESTTGGRAFVVSFCSSIYSVFFVGVFFLVHFCLLKKDRAFVVNIFPFQR